MQIRTEAIKKAIEQLEKTIGLGGEDSARIGYATGVLEAVLWQIENNP